MLTGIKEISTSEYEEMLRFIIHASRNMIIFGLGGTGKTEIGMHVAHEVMAEAPIYVNLSTMEAPDLVGLPYRDTDSNTARYSPPEWMPVKPRFDKPKVMIFDEIDKAKPELQNPLLELFQFHSINGTPLNIKAIIATANLPDEGAFSKPISGPLANRCALYRTTVVFDEWQKWAVEHGHLNSLVIGFLSKNPGMLSMKPDSNDKTAYARPSPRSWTWAAQDLDELDVYARRVDEARVDMQTRVVAGRVGESAALQFRVWLEHYRHIGHHIDALIKDGTMPPTDSMPIDRQLVLAIGCAAEAAKVANNNKVGTAAGQLTLKRVFGYISTLAPEVAIGSIKNSWTTPMMIKHDILKIPEVKNVYAKIAQALGMTTVRT